MYCFTKTRNDILSVLLWHFQCIVVTRKNKVKKKRLTLSDKPLKIIFSNQLACPGINM